MPITGLTHLCVDVLCLDTAQPHPGHWLERSFPSSFFEVGACDSFLVNPAAPLLSCGSLQRTLRERRVTTSSSSQGTLAIRILGGVQGGTGLRHWREDANPLLSVHAGLVLTPVNRAKGQHSSGFWIIDRVGLTDACGFKLAHSQRPKQDSNPGNRVLSLRILAYPKSRPHRARGQWGEPYGVTTCALT